MDSRRCRRRCCCLPRRSWVLRGGHMVQAIFVSMQALKKKKRGVAAGMALRGSERQAAPSKRQLGAMMPGTPATAQRRGLHRGPGAAAGRQAPLHAGNSAEKRCARGAAPACCRHGRSSHFRSACRRREEVKTGFRGAAARSVPCRDGQEWDLSPTAVGESEALVEKVQRSSGDTRVLGDKKS